MVKQKPVDIVYRVLDIPNVTDGDTAWMVLERNIGDASGRQVIERDYAGGSKVRLHDGLMGLNTPEEKKNPLGWRTATNDLIEYIEGWRGVSAFPGFELRTYGKDSFGRTLGNLWVPGEPLAATAVFWMIREKGWEPYRK